MKKHPGYLSEKEFDEIFQRVCNWGRWGTDDMLGTVNYIKPQHIINASRLIMSGRTVSLSIPVNKTAGPDNPNPPSHYMTRSHDIPLPNGEPRFAMDYFASIIHGDCHTHIDALCHVSYKGNLYNGKSPSTISSTGPSVQDITSYESGICGRGVLLDIPGLRGVKWLEPGEAVTSEELEAAEKKTGVTLGEGDMFLFRTGHHRRRLEKGPWLSDYGGEGRAGLHSGAIPWLHERKVAVFLPDGDGETVPSNVENVAYPIHALQIASMGMCCADNLQFEELIRVCEEEKRYEFMVVCAPLRIPGGTGSLFNPIAIF